jgi:hypothetical protein
MYDPKRLPLTPQQQIDQTRVRPWLKGVAAILLVLLGVMFAFNSVKLFSAAGISIAACTEKKVTSQLLCKLSHLVLSWVPTQNWGIYEGVLHLLVAAGFMFAAFLMLRSSSRK